MPCWIWIIDDAREVCNAFIAYWQQETADYEVLYTRFETAKAALTALAMLKENLTLLPILVLIDGHLALDHGELANGVCVVRRMLDERALDKRALIGFSADPSINGEMIAAGAHQAFSKSEYHDLLNYIKRRLAEAAR